MKLVLGDDHRMFLDALRAGLESRGHEVVGSSERLEDLVELVDHAEPDLCLLDVDFDGRSVLEPLASIRGRRPDIDVVLLSGMATTEVWSAFENHLVDGLVNKLCDIAVLDEVIERVHQGERVVERFRKPLERGRSTQMPVSLSARERAIVSLLVRGASTPQMADELGISIHTVRTHVQSVLRKFGVNSRAKAVRLAVALREAELARASGP